MRAAAENKPEPIQIGDGWTKLTDLLRCMLTVTTEEQIVAAIEKVDNAQKSKIWRIQPQFGKGKLNSAIINFDWQGKMICEL